MKLTISPYQFAVALSATSVAFGIAREFLVIGLLGLTSKNDYLQLYLSLFYIVSLFIDVMRLACLNLFSIASFKRIISAASMVSVVFICIVTFIMSYTVEGLDIFLLIVTVLGCYLNLIVAVLIAYLQRNNSFFEAQLINVLPNLILIPGIFASQYLIHCDLTLSIVILTSCIPAVQCLLLMRVQKGKTFTPENNESFLTCMVSFGRHFFSSIGEVLFQIVVRTAFYHYGDGYLSIYSVVIRTQSALRFVLVDTFIGSKLFNWNNVSKSNTALLLNTKLVFLISLPPLITSTFLVFWKHDSFLKNSIYIVLILSVGFIFSTFTRIMYFKINRYKSSMKPIAIFASQELVCVSFCYYLLRCHQEPIFFMLWLGYILKPFMQLLCLFKEYLTIVPALKRVAE